MRRQRSLAYGPASGRYSRGRSSLSFYPKSRVFEQFATLLGPRRKPGGAVWRLAPPLWLRCYGRGLARVTLSTLYETVVSRQVETYTHAQSVKSEPLHELRPRQALQERVATAILDAAARVFAEQGENASMADVAAAAGVARATVYRYFPRRETLLARLAELAAADACNRLASARISEVSPDEAVTRAVRALADVGDAFVVLARERVRPNRRQFDDAVAESLRQLFDRGQAAGAFRTDVSASWLVEALIALVASSFAAPPNVGREDTILAITNLFLNGARPRAEPDRRR